MSLRFAVLRPVIVIMLLSLDVVCVSQTFAQSIETNNGVTLETLVDSLVFYPPPAPSTMSSIRLTFEPGATYDATLPGPFALQVASGNLAFKPERHTMIGYRFASKLGDDVAGQNQSDPRLEENSLGETVLTPGWSIFIESGQLGTIRNVGDDTLVVNLVLFVPQPLYTRAAGHKTVKIDSSGKRDRESRRKERDSRPLATPLPAGE